MEKHPVLVGTGLFVSSIVNDSLFKGGYRVVKTINDRDAIKCSWRKQAIVPSDLPFESSTSTRSVTRVGGFCAV